MTNDCEMTKYKNKKIALQVLRARLRAQIWGEGKGEPIYKLCGLIKIEKCYNHCRLLTFLLLSIIFLSFKNSMYKKCYFTPYFSDKSQLVKIMIVRNQDAKRKMTRIKNECSYSLKIIISHDYYRFVFYHFIKILAICCRIC